MSFNVSNYWNSRLENNFSLQGVGYISFSKFYNTWLYKRKVVVLNRLIKKYNSNLKDKEVLDIGCGTGFFVDYYLKKKAHVTGVDITKVSVESLSKKYNGCKFYCADVSDVNFKISNQFDIINMWDVIYHQVDNKAFESTLINISKHAKKGSIFITTDTFGSKIERALGEHVVFRPIESYENIMNNLDFELLEFRPLYRFLNRPFNWSNKITNLLSPILFLFDYLNTKSVKYNLSVVVWRKK